jgi:general secretion pathway protein J
MTGLRRRRGFTLLEVLVAMALLALVMAGLLTAMRSFAQSESRIDERIRIDDDLRVSERFLRAVLATASPRARATPAGAPKEIDFDGGAREMRWIGVMPARHGAGGMYRFHLYGRPASGDEPAALVLEFTPFLPHLDAPLNPAAVQSRPMVTGIGEVRLRYQDDLASGEAWLDQWPHKDRLPRRIGLNVVGGSQPWPEIVVAVIPVAADGSSGRGGIGAGPTVGPL